jgi:hypothetical protein
MAAKWINDPCALLERWGPSDVGSAIKNEVALASPKISVFGMPRDELPVRPGQIPRKRAQIRLVPVTEGSGLVPGSKHN